MLGTAGAVEKIARGEVLRELPQLRKALYGRRSTVFASRTRESARDGNSDK